MKTRIKLIMCGILSIIITCKSPIEENSVGYGGIEGYIYLDSPTVPYVGVDVMLTPGGWFTLTDSRGYYKFQHVREGNYQMMLYKSLAFIDEFPVTIFADKMEKIDMQYFSNKPDFPDFEIV